MKDQDTTPESDLTLEEELNESADIDPKLTITKLRKRLKEAESAKQEYLTGWQRAKADFINTRKKDEESNREFAKFAKSSLVLEMIPVLDSFDMAFANKKSWEKLPEEWRRGVEHIKSQLLSVLGAQGLKELQTIGQPFNPSLEEAVGFIDTDKEENDGIVLQTLQKGYMFQEKLLRPARVMIGRYVKS